MQDHVLIDEMAHFDRERIPERVVHAKGAGKNPEKCKNNRKQRLNANPRMLWQAKVKFHSKSLM